MRFIQICCSFLEYTSHFFLFSLHPYWWPPEPTTKKRCRSHAFLYSVSLPCPPFLTFRSPPLALKFLNGEMEHLDPCFAADYLYHSSLGLAAISVHRCFGAQMRRPRQWGRGDMGNDGNKRYTFYGSEDLPRLCKVWLLVFVDWISCCSNVMVLNLLCKFDTIISISPNGRRALRHCEGVEKTDAGQENGCI